MKLLLLLFLTLVTSCSLSQDYLSQDINLLKKTMNSNSIALNSYRSLNNVTVLLEDPDLSYLAEIHAIYSSQALLFDGLTKDRVNLKKKLDYIDKKYLNIVKISHQGKASLFEVMELWQENEFENKRLLTEPAKYFGIAHIFSEDSQAKHYWVLIIARSN
ncbi:MAG: hypothetical protein HOJ38_04445 [Rhodobiaceae bacterium]|jgi:hypothetical protein|nr:hypothetical protein [Rhodobiaceae bacterium]MBT5640823.1 hypothetical protein [Rhodobiaceae bacterium]MBT6222898.1 hypothetical protein [Rhodobiaceae bacterium]